jgi:uncharacterized membrane protein
MKMDERPENQYASEHRLELFIGNFLRYSVFVVVAVVALGAVLYLPSHYAFVIDRSTFTGEPSGFRSVTGIIGLALHGEALAVIQLGLVLLILTPILRVALSAIAFVKEKDRLYVSITLLVLGLLLYSLVAG